MRFSICWNRLILIIKKGTKWLDLHLRPCFSYARKATRHWLLCWNSAGWHYVCIMMCIYPLPGAHLCRTQNLSTRLCIHILLQTQERRKQTPNCQSQSTTTLSLFSHLSGAHWRQSSPGLMVLNICNVWKSNRTENVWQFGKLYQSIFRLDVNRIIRGKLAFLLP